MSLFERWQSSIENQADNPQQQKFFKNYLEKETEAYKKILDSKTDVIEGKLSELAKEYDMDEVTFIGFLDGINSSLENELALEDLTEESEISISIVFEKLYYNMMVAKASWLYEMKEWDNILTFEERAAVRKQFNEDHRAVSNKVGRNNPCPCGSGKKYKKCCGAS
ncbi:MAG: SEC-C domain-containing protein [Clostridiaceae bacterium]|nr:SEC-C domain-containing protein [Clostridiaceae bacterium]